VETGYPHVEDWNYIPISHPVQISTQNGSNTIRPESSKLEENLEEILQDTDISNGFLNRTPMS
jgi:hypothetical protein